MKFKQLYSYLIHYLNLNQLLTLKTPKMNKLKVLGFAAVATMMMSSCAMVKAPLSGYLYTDVQSPLAVTDNGGSSKVGSAKAASILGIVATGDASVTAAAKAAGITKIHHVDQHAKNILGIYAQYEITVYGE